jgi:hypothetical protein
LSGIPTAAGTYRFTLNVTDAVGQMSSSPDTFTVSRISVSPGTLPYGAVGTYYTAIFTPSGGAPPYTFTLTSGSTSMPPGLSFSSTASSAALLGTPTSPGEFGVTYSITDSVGNT